MAKIWFKRKMFGWGWRPVTWEGWLTVGLYILFILLYFYNVDYERLTDQEVIVHILPVFTIFTALLIAISYRYGEKPRWQWRGKKIKPPFWGG